MPILEILHPWIAVLATVAVFATLQLRRGAPVDFLFLGALLFVTVTGVITPAQAFAGFANPGLLTIAGLFAVSAGLRFSGVLDWVGERLLGNAHTESSAFRRLSVALTGASAFLLNTALVAMMMPVILDWCRKRNVSPSRLLIPLSYFAILGGVCTLIGTSTTLVANARLEESHRSYEEQLATRQAAGTMSAGELAERQEFVDAILPMDFFEIGKVGLPCAVAGSIFMLLFGHRLLPNRIDLLEQLGEQRREYLVEMLVQPHCPLIGQTIEQAGLRHLPGLFLIEIDRQGEILSPVTPQDIVRAHDRLVFTGVVSTIVDLEKIPGLTPSADLTYELTPQAATQRFLTEVVLSRTSPMIGTTVREGNFRQRYNAAVIAVHRNGVRLTNKIGNIALEPGDTLLLQTNRDFVAAYRNNRDFYLVSSVSGYSPRRHHKLRTAAVLATILVLWLVAGALFGRQWLWPGLASPAIAAFAIAVAMVVTRCLRASEARNAIDLQTLVTVAAALGLGTALVESGAAGTFAEGLVGLVGHHPFLLLLVMYLLAFVFTETITNNAVAAMLLPLAIEVAAQGNVNPRPYIIAVTLAASLSFITPIGYQTNLMVMGPGGYRPVDYLRVGIPLALVVGITALATIQLWWPLAS